MTSTLRLLMCVSAGLVLCQCSSDDKKKPKKKDTANMSLAQRSMLKPDENQRSSYEKYITNPSSKGNAGAHFQKQMHQSKSFNGGDSYAGQKQFKTNLSRFGKSSVPGMDMTYSLGNKTAQGAGSAFKTDASRFGSQSARTSTFSGADTMFKTGSALSRAEGRSKAPKIIENYNDQGGKKSAYSEDEVRKLLNRN